MADIGGPVATIVAAVITGVASAWLTARFAFSRYRREKLWEERFTAYKEIMDALYKIGNHYDAAIESDALDKHIGEDRSKRLIEERDEGKHFLEKQLYISGFLLDKKVKPRVRTALSELDNAAASTDQVVYQQKSSDAVWACIADIESMAKNDLKQ